MSKLVLSNAGFKYGNKAVLSAISFETTPGEFLGIIGPTARAKALCLKGWPIYFELIQAA